VHVDHHERGAPPHPSPALHTHAHHVFPRRRAGVRRGGRGIRGVKQCVALATSQRTGCPGRLERPVVASRALGLLGRGRGAARRVRGARVDIDSFPSHHVMDESTLLTNTACSGCQVETSFSFCLPSFPAASGPPSGIRLKTMGEMGVSLLDRYDAVGCLRTACQLPFRLKMRGLSMSVHVNKARIVCVHTRE